MCQFIFLSIGVQENQKWVMSVFAHGINEHYSIYILLQTKMGHLLCYGTSLPDAFQWRNRCLKSVSLTYTCVTSSLWVSISYCLSHDNWLPYGRLFDLCYSDMAGANLIYFPSLFQEWLLPYFILFLSKFKSVEKNYTSFNVPVSQREEIQAFSKLIYFFP